MLNNGDGTFATMQPYAGGTECAGVAVDITLGDVTTPAPGNRLLPDGKLDAYIACTPYVVRLTGDGAGALTNPEPFNLGVAQYLGSQTLDMLTLMRRQNSTPTTPPLLVFQHAANPGRRLCISYDLVPGQEVCSATPVQGPLAVGDLNGFVADVPPDEVVTSEGGALMGIFGFAPVLPLQWSDSTRSVPGTPPGLESVAMGDLDNDGDLDVLAGQYVNSLSDRVDSIHYFKWDPVGSGGLEQVPHTLPSTAGLDAVAVADVDGDGCSDVVGAGAFGRAMVHLGNAAGGFDGGTDLPQIGYGNPATATRVTMAVGDLTGDGRPEIVVSDAVAQKVMVHLNASTTAGSTCGGIVTPPPPPPPPPPGGPSTCDNPGVTPLTVGTAGEDVLVGTSGRDVLNGLGGDDCVFGLANADRMSGGTGKDLLSGSSGDDRIKGDAGADRLNGGNGNDSITPGAGTDRVSAQGGNDTISARDGDRDIIDCGPGRDKVTADRNDQVKNCETVRRS
jgi:hypothetical protein